MYRFWKGGKEEKALVLYGNIDVRKDLTKVFDPNQPPSLNGINVTIPQGKIVGLAGPDGAGKTTLIRLMAALLLPTEGHIEVAGHDTVLDPEGLHRDTGYMPQRFGLYEDLTVLQNLNLYAEFQSFREEAL